MPDNMLNIVQKTLEEIRPTLPQEDGFTTDFFSIAGRLCYHLGGMYGGISSGAVLYLVKWNTLADSSKTLATVAAAEIHASYLNRHPKEQALQVVKVVDQLLEDLKGTDHVRFVNFQGCDMGRALPDRIYR